MQETSSGQQTKTERYNWEAGGVQNRANSDYHAKESEEQQSGKVFLCFYF